MEKDTTDSKESKVQPTIESIDQYIQLGTTGYFGTTMHKTSSCISKQRYVMSLYIVTIIVCKFGDLDELNAKNKMHPLSL